MRTTAALIGATAVPGLFTTKASAAGNIRVGLVAKSAGMGFFVACHRGAVDAAKEIGGVEVIYTGPTRTTAEGQIEIIQSLIGQRVDAIAIAANDPDALIPICRRAMERGIKVISFDSAINPDGRLIHLAPSNDDLVGEMCVKLTAAAVPDGKGKFAVVSGPPTSANQNAWIAGMKKVLPQYPGLEFGSVVYGNDMADDAYREATALLKKEQDLKVIVGISDVNIVACAKAVEDAGMVGKVYVTGLGLPSACIGHVDNGTIKSFALWNPVDLGYAATYLAVDMVRGMTGPGNKLPAGKLGDIAFDADGLGAMAVPYTFDKSNIKEWASQF